MADLTNTVKLINDTCVPVRYFLTDAEKYKSEAIVTDILSLLPFTSSLTDILTVKSIITNVVGLSAEITGSSLIQTAADFLSVKKSKEGILNPRETVERQAGNQAVLNRNQVKVEYISFNADKTSIFLTTFNTEPLLDSTELKLSKILVEQQQDKRPIPVSSVPSPWKKTTMEIKMTLDDSCVKPWRLLRIPNLHLTLGACTVEVMTQNVKDKSDIVDGIFCNTINDGEDNGSIYPYTFTSNSTSDETTLGGWHSTNSMIYFDAPGGRSGGCYRRLLNNCIPVVQLNNCHIRKEGEQHQSAETHGKLHVDQVLAWWWGRIKEREKHHRTIHGNKYWAISWSRTGEVYCLDATESHDVKSKFILVKKERYLTFMMCVRTH
ncbi:hypothetical protein SAMD00023353_13400070 [Rosellinia necatrix]|uniref:Uncharacterized protein n=1 Tax=Rosellinia necatrix TaxID=77044 RepID=A0A1W2TAD6_ROSNE|nr:hypothetical protein SAMD00023353_13400070 [Rosellinia necatrix]